MTDIQTYRLEKSKVYQIISIYKKIELFPEYQRHGGLWTTEKKQLFIDSILSGYDIPKLYVHVLKKPKKVGKKYSIIDGRQRIETLREFMNNEFPLGDYEVPLRGKIIKTKEKFYKDLAKNFPTLRSRFDEFRLPVICVETIDDELDLIEEMFSRLNEAVSINSAEKRNAINGFLVGLIRKTTKHPFFIKDASFTNKRFQHHEVSVRLLFLENCILEGKIKDTKKKNLDEFAKMYKTKHPDQLIYKTTKSVLDTMSRMFHNDDKLLKAQGRIPIYYLLVRQAKKQRKLRNVTREKIETFHKKVLKNRELFRTDPELAKNELIEYDRLTIQGTNDSSSIQRRFTIISKIFGIDSSEIRKLSSSTIQ